MTIFAAAGSCCPHRLDRAFPIVFALLRSSHPRRSYTCLYETLTERYTPSSRPLLSLLHSLPKASNLFHKHPSQTSCTSDALLSIPSRHVACWTPSSCDTTKVPRSLVRPSTDHILSSLRLSVSKFHLSPDINEFRTQETVETDPGEQSTSSDISSCHIHLIRWREDGIKGLGQERVSAVWERRFYRSQSSARRQRIRSMTSADDGDIKRR